MRFTGCPLCYKISFESKSDNQNKKYLQDQFLNLDTDTKQVQNQKIETHNLRKCEKFQVYKLNLTKENYIGLRLNLADSIGFCSAGIIPWFIDNKGKINLLGLYETRESSIKINFIGGGREGNISNHKKLVKMETPKQTAINEFIEEMGQMISLQSLNPVKEYLIRMLHNNKYKVMWIGKSKMVYYLVHMPQSLINEITDLKKPGKIFLDKLSQTYCKTVGYEWFVLNELYWYDCRYNELHQFTKPIVNSLKDNENQLFWS